jgi:hypothetical protein
MGAPGPAVGTGDSKNLNHPLPDPTPTKLPAENPDTLGSAQNPRRWKSPAAPHAAGGPLIDTAIHLFLAPKVSLCPIHRSFIAMSGPRSRAVHSDSISTAPRIPVA